MTKFITPKQIKQKLTNKYTVIAISASWCGPCNIMTRMVWDPINQEGGDISIFKIDVNEHKAWVESLKIIGVPTMLIYKNDQKVETFSGYMTKDDFEKRIREL